MALYGCSCSNVIQKMSRVDSMRGLRDTDYECTLSLSFLLRRACQGRPGRTAGAGAPPVAALGIIGQVASRLPVNEEINSSQKVKNNSGRRIKTKNGARY